MSFVELDGGKFRRAGLLSDMERRVTFKKLET